MTMKYILPVLGILVAYDASCLAPPKESPFIRGGPLRRSFTEEKKARHKSYFCIQKAIEATDFLDAKIDDPVLYEMYDSKDDSPPITPVLTEPFGSISPPIQRQEYKKPIYISGVGIVTPVLMRGFYGYGKAFEIVNVINSFLALPILSLNMDQVKVDIVVNGDFKNSLTPSIFLKFIEMERDGQPRDGFKIRMRDATSKFIRPMLIRVYGDFGDYAVFNLTHNVGRVGRYTLRKKTYNCDYITFDETHHCIIYHDVKGAGQKVIIDHINNEFVAGLWTKDVRYVDKSMVITLKMKSEFKVYMEEFLDIKYYTKVADLKNINDVAGRNA